MARRRSSSSRGHGSAATLSRSSRRGVRGLAPTPIRVRLPARKRTLFSTTVAGRGVRQSVARSKKAIFAARKRAPLLSSIRATAVARPKVTLRGRATRASMVSTPVRGTIRSPEQRELCRCTNERSEAQRVTSRKLFAAYGARGLERKKIHSCTC